MSRCKACGHDPQDDRRWQVVYALIYDNGQIEWTQGYRTLLGAMISRWLHLHVRSWGGSAILADMEAAR